MLRFPLFRRRVEDTRIFVERKNLPMQFNVFGIALVTLQWFFSLELVGIFRNSQSTQELGQNALLCFFMFSTAQILQLFPKKVLVLTDSRELKLGAALFALSSMLIFAVLTYFFQSILGWEYWLKFAAYSLTMGLIFYYRLAYLRKMYLRKIYAPDALADKPNLSAKTQGFS